MAGGFIGCRLGSPFFLIRFHILFSEKQMATLKSNHDYDVVQQAQCIEQPFPGLPAQEGNV